MIGSANSKNLHALKSSPGGLTFLELALPASRIIRNTRAIFFLQKFSIFITKFVNSLWVKKPVWSWIQQNLDSVFLNLHR
jgi:hypothetical protein